MRLRPPRYQIALPIPFCIPWRLLASRHQCAHLLQEPLSSFLAPGIFSSSSLIAKHEHGPNTLKTFAEGFTWLASLHNPDLLLRQAVKLGRPGRRSALSVASMRRECFCRSCKMAILICNEPTNGIRGISVPCHLLKLMRKAEWFCLTRSGAG